MAVLDSILKKYKVDNSAKELTEPPQRYKAHKTEFRASGNYPKGAVHQMDVLFLPDDKSDGKQFGYRYLLVVSDVGSGKMDARAMKFKKGVGSTKRKASKGKPLTALDRAFNAEKKGVLDHVQDIYKSGKPSLFTSPHVDPFDSEPPLLEGLPSQPHSRMAGSATSVNVPSRLL